LRYIPTGICYATAAILLPLVGSSRLKNNMTSGFFTTPPGFALVIEIRVRAGIATVSIDAGADVLVRLDTATENALRGELVHIRSLLVAETPPTPVSALRASVEISARNDHARVDVLFDHERFERDLPPPEAEAFAGALERTLNMLGPQREYQQHSSGTDSALVDELEP
jgi:hypothetical protein